MHTSVTTPFMGVAPELERHVAVDSLKLSIRELFSHVAIFGQTGSGKTRFCLLPLVEALLGAFGDSPDLKPGMLIFDSKGDMGAHLRVCLKAVGRESDLIVIGPGEGTHVPLFARCAGNAREAAVLLVSLGEISSSNHSGKGGENDMYWLESVARYLEAVLILAKAVHGADFGGIDGVCQSLRHADALLSQDESDDEDGGDVRSKRVASAVRLLEDGILANNIDYSEYRQVRDLLQHELREVGERTLGTITQYAHNFLVPFENRWIADILSPGAKEIEYSPERIIQEGKIVLVQLSQTLLGRASGPLSDAIKIDFQRAALQRAHTYHRQGQSDEQINQQRPVLYVVDEFHTLCTAGVKEGDPFFFDRARESNVIAIVATQGISALRAAIPNSAQIDHMLNNCTTKIFFRSVNCPDTSSYLERVSGNERRITESESFGPTSLAPRFRLPNHRFVPGRRSVRSGVTRRVEDRPRVDGALLRHQKTGEALVLRNDGRIEHVSFSGGRYLASGKAVDG